MSKLSHFDRHGEARMVDIAAKAVTHRIAIAEGTIAMNRETLTIVEEGLHKKGDVLGIARIAGIMARNKVCVPLPPFTSFTLGGSSSSVNACRAARKPLQ